MANAPSKSGELQLTPALFAQELALLGCTENTNDVCNDIVFDDKRISPGLMEILKQYDCFDKDGKLRYNIINANGCSFLVDPLKPALEKGENAVYQFHDEARELLRIATALGEKFDTVIDAFRGGGHSTLPLVKAGVAKKGESIDTNPRSLHLSRVNAIINGLGGRTNDIRGDTTIGLPPRMANEKTLFVGNPPFALKAQGIELDKMRDGGENGLTLTNAYIEKAIGAAHQGDVVIGVAYSRIGANGEIELEPIIQRILGDRGTYVVEIVEGETLWRQHDGVKRSANPMPLDDLYLKAAPDDKPAIAAYRTATEFHKSEGWERLGYFRYVIRVDRAAQRQEGIHSKIESTLA